jgi:hypothetical protein
VSAIKILTGWTADELLTAAAEQGTPATRRLIVDWTSLGLIDRPHRRGRGQGAGSQPGTWPEEQRQLFLQLLRKREEIKHVVPLLNFPVALWLLWGDGYVPLRQTRRALITWAAANGKPSKARARKTANAFLNTIGGPGVGAAKKKLLVEAITETLLDPDSFDREEMASQLRRVLEPRGQSTTQSPFGLLPASEAFASVMEARIEAFRQISTVSDELVIETRVEYLDTRARYSRDLPYLLASPRSQMFEARSPSDEVRNACVDFLTELGFVLLRHQGSIGTWRDEEVTVTT